jgi:hypothetical protein
VCSLKSETPQLLAPGRFHIVRFPFGRAESYDEHRMHQTAQPDGHQVTDWTRDDRAGLIWPAAEGWGVLSAMVQWEPGGYSQLDDRFVRDPLGLSTGWDATATDERTPSRGGQRFTKVWQMFVNPETPIALQVQHNDDRPRRLLLAEFKLAIHT